MAQAAEQAAVDRACCIKLAQVFSGSLDHARALGLACGADARTAAAAIDALCPAAGEREWLARAPLDQVRRWLDRKIRSDFRAGRVRLIGGWMLSETEAGAFVLSAMA